jgi:tripartite-type tricarboxylate transporter receptor subunit TctC
MIAINAVAKAPPDGYLLGLGGAGALGALLGVQEMTYDPRKDIVPVAAVGGTPFILAAAPSFKGQSLRDVLALARGAAGKLSIAHGGNGTTMHLTAELLNQMAGTSIGLVPYRGSAPVVTDLMGDHIALGIVDPPSAIAAIESGKIRTIAIASPARFPRLPDIPTFAEAGLPGFESNGWVGIVAPAGTPANIIARLNEAIVAELKDPEAIERIRALGSEPMPMGQVEFAEFVAKEIDKWLKVAAASKK